MSRRIIPTFFAICVLLCSILLLPGSQVLALTATLQPRTSTPTLTRTVTPVACSVPTYFVNVTPSATTLNTGDQITVTVYTNVGLSRFYLSIYDNATGLLQNAADPILSPGAPDSQLPPAGTSTVSWTLTAIRAGSVTIGGSVYGEVQACSNGNYYWVYSSASGVAASSVTVSGPSIPVTPTFTPTTIPGDLGYGAVSGRVTDAVTGAAISGAVVSCSHTSYRSVAPCTGTRTTGVDGRYSFDNVFFHDTDNISVTAAAANGYITQTITKSFFTTTGMTANFAMVAATGNLPDLKVLSISEYAYTLPTGTPNAQGCWYPAVGGVGLRVTIQNAGTADAGSFILDLNGVRPTVAGLAAGQTLLVDFAGISLSNRTRTATIDATGLIIESDEINNTYVWALPAATSTRTGTPRPPVTPICRTSTPTVTATSGTLTTGPDLAIASISYAGSSPACANAPRNAVVVVNNGSVAAGSFSVSYGASGMLTTVKTVAGLAAGQSVTLYFPIASGAGMTVTATADSTNAVAETNETNNSASAMLPIPTQGPTCTPTSTPSRTPTPTSNVNQPDLSFPSTPSWVWDPGSYDSANSCYNHVPYLVWRVDVKNTGSAAAGSFVVSHNYFASPQSVAGLAAGQSATLYFSFPGGTGNTTPAGQPTLVPNTANFIADYNNTVNESNESNNRTFNYIPLFTATPSTGPTRVFCKTNTPTPTPTITRTPTLTPTVPGGACSPVSATIAAPFSKDGAGSFCWQASNLGGYINSWNMNTLTINGVNYTNAWASTASLPAKINGFWYIRYTGSYAWSHFEAK